MVELNAGYGSDGSGGSLPTRNDFPVDRRTSSFSGSENSRIASLVSMTRLAIEDALESSLIMSWVVN